MAIFTQAFKVQSVEKALSRRPDQTLEKIADDLGVGYSTLQKWIRLAKQNKLEYSKTIISKEQSPQELEAEKLGSDIMKYYGLWKI